MITLVLVLSGLLLAVRRARPLSLIMPSLLASPDGSPQQSLLDARPSAHL